MSLALHCRLALACALIAPLAAAAADAPIEVRVGIVAYQDSKQDADRVRKQLSEIAGASAAPIRARFALGTYGDVLHWMDRKSIPSPSPAASRRSSPCGKWASSRSARRWNTPTRTATPCGVWRSR